MGANAEPTIAYVGLGSNLGDRIGYLQNAVNDLTQIGEVMAISSVFETEPFGVDEAPQPMYLNMAVSIRTFLSAEQVLAELSKIEKSNGRVRHHRNESRTLDLDLLMFGEESIESRELTVPHPRMIERAFVMLPLAEIASRVVHPTVCSTMSQIANALPDQGVLNIGTLRELSAKSPVSRPARKCTPRSLRRLPK